MKIFTHTGKLNSDELLSLALLKELNPDAEVVRVDTLGAMDSMDAAVAVGDGEFGDSDVRQYRTGRTDRSRWNLFGNVWDKFGADMLEQFGCRDIDRVMKHIKIYFVDYMRFVARNGDYPDCYVDTVANFIEDSYDLDGLEAGIEAAKQVLSHRIRRAM